MRRSSRSPIDPDRVPYEQLLAVFWAEHDPTQLNRQGPDVGDQYRSAIFVHDERSGLRPRPRATACRPGSSRPVVTQIEDAPTFWPAEDYHQQYLEKRGLATCHVALAS